MVREPKTHYPGLHAGKYLCGRDAQLASFAAAGGSATCGICRRVPEAPARATGALPVRVAEVAHALMEAWTQSGGSVPVTTHEVWEYDTRSPCLGSTSSTLARAMRYGLADRAAPRGLWIATNRAWEIRRELEDRVLGEGKGHG